MLIQRNYMWNVELITDDKTIKTKPSTEGNEDYNYHNVNTGRMYLQSYKTSTKYRAIDITLSTYTQKVISKSYDDNPRKYLFETDGGKYSSSSTFGSQIGETIGNTINQVRRASINYHYHIKNMSRDKIAKVAGHSVDVNELT